MGQTWTAVRQSWETLQARGASQAAGTATEQASVSTPLLAPYGLSMPSMTSLSGGSTLALGLMGEHLQFVRAAGVAAMEQVLLGRKLTGGSCLRRLAHCYRAPQCSYAGLCMTSCTLVCSTEAPGNEMY